MDGLDTLAQALGITDRKDADWHVLAKVSAVNPDGSLTVYMAGSLNPTTVDAYCDAQAGDVVCVLISKGKARAIARKGGAIDDSGSAVCSLNSHVTAGEIQLDRSGGFCEVRVAGVYLDSFSSRTTIGTIPEGFRPKGESYVFDTSLKGYFVLLSDGRVQAEASLASRWVYASGAYKVGG